MLESVGDVDAVLVLRSSVDGGGNTNLVREVSDRAYQRQLAGVEISEE